MQSNFTIGVPTPETAPEPTRYLTMPDGETRLPLEYPCRVCKGAASNVCSACMGKGSELSMQGRALLAFLKKWWDHAEEAPERPWSAQDNVLAAAHSRTVTNVGETKKNG